VTFRYNYKALKHGKVTFSGKARGRADKPGVVTFVASNVHAEMISAPLMMKGAKGAMRGSWRG
jgi:hypothetical protein